jgi:uncharacterized protein (TIGR00304 family)
VLIVIGSMHGDTKFGLLFIVPFFVFSDPLSVLGVLLVLFGGIGLMVSYSSSKFEFDLGYNDDETPPRTKKGRKRPKSGISSGGVVFIGPVPIVWGSNKGIGKTMIYVALGITLILVILFIINIILTIYY